MQCTCSPKPHLSLKIAASKPSKKLKLTHDFEDPSVSFLYLFLIARYAPSAAEALSSNIGRHVGHPQGRRAKVQVIFSGAIWGWA